MHDFGGRIVMRTNSCFEAPKDCMAQPRIVPQGFIDTLWYKWWIKEHRSNSLIDDADILTRNSMLDVDVNDSKSTRTRLRKQLQTKPQVLSRRLEAGSATRAFHHAVIEVTDRWKVIMTLLVAYGIPLPGRETWSRISNTANQRKSGLKTTRPRLERKPQPPLSPKKSQHHSRLPSQPHEHTNRKYFQKSRPRKRVPSWLLMTW